MIGKIFWETKETKRATKIEGNKNCQTIMTSSDNGELHYGRVPKEGHPPLGAQGVSSVALAMAIMDLMVEARKERYLGRFHCSKLMQSLTS